MIYQHRIVFGNLLAVQLTKQPLGKGALLSREVKDVNEFVTIQPSRAGCIGRVAGDEAGETAKRFRITQILGVDLQHRGKKRVCGDHETMGIFVKPVEFFRQGQSRPLIPRRFRGMKGGDAPHHAGVGRIVDIGLGKKLAVAYLRSDEGLFVAPSQMYQLEVRIQLRENGQDTGIAIARCSNARKAADGLMDLLPGIGTSRPLDEVTLQFVEISTVHFMDAFAAAAAGSQYLVDLSGNGSCSVSPRADA